MNKLIFNGCYKLCYNTTPNLRQEGDLNNELSKTSQACNVICTYGLIWV